MIKDLLIAINTPVTAIAALIVIFGALCAVYFKINTSFIRLTGWWRRRHERATIKGRELIDEVNDNRTSYSNKKRLKKLQQAYKLFKRAHSYEFQGDTLYKIAMEQSAIPSYKQALLYASNAAVLLKKAGMHGYAADAYKLAGDLCLFPKSQRDIGKADTYFSKARNLYNNNGMQYAANRMDLETKSIKENL